MKKNTKILAATGVTLFSLVAFFTATIAWFSLNKNVGAEGIFIVARDGNSYKAGLSIHKCLTNESTFNTLSFNYADATESQFRIDNYTRLNTTQPVLILFPMGIVDENTGDFTGAPASNINLNVISDTGVGYADVDTEDPTARNHYNRFPFSNVCSFRVVAWTEDVPTNATSVTNPTRYYVDFTSIGESDSRCFVGQSQSFVTPESSNLVWNSSSLNLFNGSLLPNASSTIIKYLGVVIDYYEPALSVIFRAGGYLGPNPLTFLMDFSMVVS